MEGLGEGEGTGIVSRDDSLDAEGVRLGTQNPCLAKMF